ncbi:MAG: N-acyl homoserine lactonase family protein [Acidimicrobiales bacterium]|nr:N-acyl homoserine lactonase family protein [Acidimicrobiales bacterium]
MRLLGLRCGGLATDMGLLLEGRPSGVQDVIPVMCFAVDTGNGVLVFDTGLHESCCGNGAADHYGVLIQTFDPVCGRQALIDERLRQAGIGLDEVRWVTNSHLHFDHTGRNGVFAGATHLVRSCELAFARSRLTKPFGFIKDEIDTAESFLAGDGWDYDERHEVASGVVLIDTAGHTPGHQALEVTFRDGQRFICIGDAAYTLEAVDQKRLTGRPADRDRAVATLEALREASRAGAKLLTAHDIDQWRTTEDVTLLHASTP